MDAFPDYIHGCLHGGDVPNDAWWACIEGYARGEITEGEYADRRRFLGA
jgi:hypothetical protein